MADHNADDAQEDFYLPDPHEVPSPGFDPSLSYTREQLAKAWPCDSDYISILLKSGLREMRPTLEGTARITGEDFQDILRQKAIADGNDNVFDKELFDQLHDDRKKKRDARTKKTKKRKRKPK